MTVIEMMPARLEDDEFPTLGVIMPCLNEVEHIRDSIESVLAFDYPPDLMTLTVVDGMSNDGTREIIESIAADDARVKLLDNPEKLHAPALNRAIDSLSCAVVLRTDAHSTYPRDYARLSVSALLTTGAENAGGVFVTVPGADTAEARAVAFALSHPFGVGNASYRNGPVGPQWTDTVPFGCWRLSTLRRIGGFATDIPYGEDDELNGRIIKGGGRVLLDPAIIAKYVARSDLRSFMLMLFRYGRSKPISALRLGRVATLRQLIPALFVATILSSVLLAVAWPTALYLALLAVVMQLAVGTAIAVNQIAGIGLATAFRLPHTFLAAHLSYGFGYFAGTLCAARDAIKQPLGKGAL